MITDAENIRSNIMKKEKGVLNNKEDNKCRCGEHQTVAFYDDITCLCDEPNTIHRG